MDTAQINVISLCSGIGGLDLGLRMAVPNARTVCYVEIEAFCCACLVAAMEDGRLDPAPLWTDLRTFDGRRWRDVVDCLIAGYPCQPFSVAGKQLGTDDPRHLWPDVYRIIQEIRPGLIVLENVAGHIRLGLDVVLSDLAAIGYDAEWCCVGAHEIGAHFPGRRLFALARSQTSRLRLQGRGTLPPGAWGQQQLEGLLQDQVRPDVPADASRGVPDGARNRVDRLRALGNGVVPQQAAYAITQLLDRIKDFSPAP